MDNLNEEQIDAQKVLDTLKDLDEKEKKGEDEKPEPKKPEPKKPEPTVEQPKPDDNTALRVAWGLVNDLVKEACPDLDEEMLGIARDAAGNDPVAYKTKAKAMQAKVAAKKSANPDDKTQDVQALAAKIFDGGGKGGDATVTKVKEPTAEEKMQEAVAKGDSRGILQGIAKNINDKKMFERGVTVVVD